MGEVLQRMVVTEVLSSLSNTDEDIMEDDNTLEIYISIKDLTLLF